MNTYRQQVWNDTITLYHRTEGKDAAGKKLITWTRFVLRGCFYGLKARQVVSGTEIVSRNAVMARIPWASIDVPIFAIGKSDIIVRGEADDVLPDNDSGSALKAKYPGNCFTVNSVADNSKLPRTAHYYASED